VVQTSPELSAECSIYKFDMFAECNKDMEAMLKKAPEQNNVLFESLAACMVHHISCKLWPFHAGGGCPGLTCATGVVPLNIDAATLSPCRPPTGWTVAS
jgi:hypothetical protein